MKLVRRRLTRKDTDYELVFGALFIPIGVLFGFVLSRLPLDWFPRCRLHALVGLACPTCGTLRSLRLLTAGRLADAWLMQPLSISLALAAMLYAGYALIVVLGRLPRVRLADVTRREKKTAAFAVAGLILVNWAYLLARGI